MLFIIVWAGHCRLYNSTHSIWFPWWWSYQKHKLESFTLQKSMRFVCSVTSLQIREAGYKGEEDRTGVLLKDTQEELLQSLDKSHSHTLAQMQVHSVYKQIIQLKWSIGNCRSTYGEPFNSWVNVLVRRKEKRTVIINILLHPLQV